MNTKIENIKINLSERSYDITVGCGILKNADKYLPIKNRRCVIVTDTGVPKEYSKTVASFCSEYKIITFEQGEKSKNIETFAYICKEMLAFGLQRRDLVIAVGGGVVGDIAGYAAASYMRGVDFCNVPTTLLSMVDSSIGGKTAIDFCGVKNILGAFHQPRAVLIDTSLLSTLDKRQFSSGLAEIVKMSLTSDKALFELLEKDIWKDDINETVVRALRIKKAVVEADEKENELRKILNFGHTFGHGVEACTELLHGECVALGMLPMSSETVRERLILLLKKMRLPHSLSVDPEEAFEFMNNDKKGDGSKVSAVFVDDIGSYRLEAIELSDLKKHIKASICKNT